MKTTHSLALIACAIAALVLFTAARSPEPADPAPHRTISVAGTAVVHTVPDIVV